MPFAEQPLTLVEFILDESATGTRLTLVESGFAALPAEMRARAFADNSGGWDSELAELVAYVATPVAV